MGTKSRMTRIALLCEALVAGRARWEPFAGQTRSGEVCVGGMRYTTKLDGDGIPEVHDVLVRALIEAASRAA